MRSKPETPTGRLQHVTGIAMKRTADVTRGVGVERTKRPKNWVLGHWVLRRAESGWSLSRRSRTGVCVSWRPHEDLLQGQACSARQMQWEGLLRSGRRTDLWI